MTKPLGYLLEAVGSVSMRCELLNGFAVFVEGRPVVIRGARSRQVLAYLTLQAGTTVSVDRLIDSLWSESPPTSARNSVQRFISDLRRDLEDAADRIEHTGQGYRLSLFAGDGCDALDAERDLPTARKALNAGRPADALAISGPIIKTSAEPLAGLESAAFVPVEQARLSELMAEFGELESEAHLAVGNPGAAIASARKTLAVNPYRESLCLTLATALKRQGRANDALQEIATFRAKLTSDLGLDVSPTIRQLELDILNHAEDSRPRNAPRHVPPIHRTMPANSAPRLLGREEMVVRAASSLETARLVTFIGTGGIGKTAAAKATQDRWQTGHEGRARYVSLEDISAHGIAAAIGQAVGTSTNPGNDPLSEIVDRICAEVGLLVLDNCEHVIDEVGAFLREVLARNSPVRVLATSRRPLGLPEERLLALKSLDGDSSRALLLEQLDAASVNLVDVDDVAFAELLDELDGLPLAIELAGACLRSIGVRDLLLRWRDQDPAVQHDDDRAERHRSVTNALRSTIEQLTPEHLDVLQLCAFFPSDFTLAAVEALADAPVLAELRVLVDYSLLEVRHLESAARYRMLVPVRAEVRAQFGPLAARPRTAFVSHYESVAAAALEKMKADVPKQGVAELRSELTNLSFAFELADDLGDLPAMASIVRSVGLANGMSLAIGAKSHLHDWGSKLRLRLDEANLDEELTTQLWTAAAWGMYGSGDGGWYLRWESETHSEDAECLGMAAIARFSRGQSSESWELLRDLDLASIADPYLRSLLCGIGAVIAFEVGAPEGHDLADLAGAAASVRPSPGASFFATLARSAQALNRNDIPLCLALLESNVQTIDGHGLVTLENMARAGLAMTSGTILRSIDPAEQLEDLVGRYLDQHSLDPASIAMALDAASLRLAQADRPEDAAMLLGLLDRLGLSMAILKPARSRLEAAINNNPDHAKSRAIGSMRTTYEVLESTRQALFEVGERASLTA